MSEPAVDPAPRVRRERTLTEKLLSIVLGLEAILTFFVALAAFGLRVLPVSTALIGGAVLIAVLLLASRFVRYPWGAWLGWVLQAVILATGLLLPAMWVVGAAFLALWIYCFVRARAVDRAHPIGARADPPSSS
ncbi:MAG: hypothetical protein JWR53_10 [Glaciihabitans sp.]|nr:hypothetical protein [Glaciihabitans sp.]MCU1533529.1 hypothetical protein [Glaciihabitans sp.]